jgi:hypothetical protein
MPVYKRGDVIYRLRPYCIAINKVYEDITVPHNAHVAILYSGRCDRCLLAQAMNEQLSDEDKKKFIEHWKSPDVLPDAKCTEFCKNEETKKFHCILNANARCLQSSIIGVNYGVGLYEVILKKHSCEPTVCIVQNGIDLLYIANRSFDSDKEEMTLNMTGVESFDEAGPVTHLYVRRTFNYTCQCSKCTMFADKEMKDLIDLGKNVYSVRYMNELMEKINKFDYNGIFEHIKNDQTYVRVHALLELKLQLFSGELDSSEWLRYEPIIDEMIEAYQNDPNIYINTLVALYWCKYMMRWNIKDIEKIMKKMFGDDWVPDFEVASYMLLVKRCFNPKCETTTKDLSRCSGCHQVWYCNKECQKADWPRHKKIFHRAKGVSN